MFAGRPHPPRDPDAASPRASHVARATRRRGKHRESRLKVLERYLEEMKRRPGEKEQHNESDQQRISNP